ncbi:MAG: 3-phenylpropionate/cinnamic acid dioxygenase subunit beta [Propionibacteriaceae bacterium]|jgi:3-phenylpropionate/cinnamic acid dioxygenase small subunit|nr:3-phenylpropionate/cinnamic acid dioxygenase subunit beta [Propionibacteriaceae bacterium]
MTDNVSQALTAVTAADQRAIERFLYEEVKVLDDWEWVKWLDFLHDDIMYWAPTQEDRYSRERSKRIAEFGTSAYFEDNKTELSVRVHRMLTNQAWSEEPPSRSRHIITNIMVDPGVEPGEFKVRSHFFDYRSNGQRAWDMVTGQRDDVIVRAPESEWGYLIKTRRILFDMSIILNKNLTLFY